MSGKITKISDSEFDSLVLVPKKPAVVFFSAKWCGASRMAKPILETAAEKYNQRASFYEVNIDDNYETAMKYNVNSLPTIMTFAFGEIGGRSVGGINRDKLNGMIEKIIVSGELYRNLMAYSKKFAVGVGRRFGV
jgi:thioredoxin 1